MLLCPLFPQVSELFNTNQSHIPGTNVLPRSEAPRGKRLVCFVDHCITNNFKSAQLHSCASNICWINRTYSLCGLTSVRLPSWGFLLIHDPLFFLLLLQLLFPLQVLNVIILQSSILGHVTDELSHYHSSKSYTCNLHVQPLSLPEIQASVSNLSNSKSHAYLMFIQNRFLSSHFLF